jgi:hypothetical protein
MYVNGKLSEIDTRKSWAMKNVNAVNMGSKKSSKFVVVEALTLDKNAIF